MSSFDNTEPVPLPGHARGGGGGAPPRSLAALRVDVGGARGTPCCCVGMVARRLEARVVGAEAGNAEERENATLVAKNAGSVTRGGPAHDATSQRCVERVASTTNEDCRRKCVSCGCARAKPRVLAPARCFAPVLDRSAAGSVRGNDARVSSPGRVCVASRKPDRCRATRTGTGAENTKRGVQKFTLS